MCAGDQISGAEETGNNGRQEGGNEKKASPSAGKCCPTSTTLARSSDSVTHTFLPILEFGIVCMLGK